MSDWFILVLAILATFRLATMIALEKGPGFIFRKARKVPPPKSATREGLSCPLCVGTHIALLVTIALVFLGHTDWYHAPLWWFAISGGAVACHFQWTKDL
jgi:hypothetical protein